MTDVLLELGKNPWARKLVSSAKLPIPIPAGLPRLSGARAERFLEGRNVLASGAGALSDVIARTLSRAGASTQVDSAALLTAFTPAAEAYGRPTKQLVPDESLAAEPAHAFVVDASALDTPLDLKQLYAFIHNYLPRLARGGRIVVLGRPVDDARDVNQASTRAALEGFTRSLAKELGGKGATANLIYVAEGAESRLPAALRFVLSPASAFVTAQPFRLSATSQWTGDDPWVKPLSNKVALVTGAARGIGEATARVLAAEGAHVVLLDRPDDDEPLSVVTREIGGQALLADVQDPTAPGKIASELKKLHGGVDIIVHNAGVTRDRTLARMPESSWDQVLGINLDALVRITDTLINDRVLRDQGRIVSLASIAGIAGNTGQTNYAASKAGVIGFTRFLAKQLAPRGITVNAVAPGFIETRMTAAVPVVVREAGRRLSALGQGGLPEDVARAIAYFAEPGSAGSTGQVLRVCGGALLGA
ncbi:MAG: 3-oxoacyl-ACP reductase [Polyangiales bacterium]